MASGQNSTTCGCSARPRDNGPGSAVLSRPRAAQIQSVGSTALRTSQQQPTYRELAQVRRRGPTAPVTCGFLGVQQQAGFRLSIFSTICGCSAPPQNNGPGSVAPPRRVRPGPMGRSGRRRLAMCLVRGPGRLHGPTTPAITGYTAEATSTLIATCGNSEKEVDGEIGPQREFTGRTRD